MLIATPDSDIPLRPLVINLRDAPVQGVDADGLADALTEVAAALAAHRHNGLQKER